eukprot:2690068-Rhodomonas_salina.5
MRMTMMMMMTMMMGAGQVNKQAQSAWDIAKQAKQGLLMDLLGWTSSPVLLRSPSISHALSGADVERVCCNPRRAVEERADAAEQELAKSLMLLSFAVQDGDVEKLTEGLQRGDVDINTPVSLRCAFWWEMSGGDLVVGQVLGADGGDRVRLTRWATRCCTRPRRTGRWR